MSTRHFWRIFGRVNILHYCFSRQLGETSSHINIAENPEAKSPPLGNPQIFHRQLSTSLSTLLFPTPLPPKSQQTKTNGFLTANKMSTSESTSTQTAQITHQQPAIGSPAWIRIPASNVPRAQKFYQEVFGWKFHDHSKEGYAVNKLAVFTIPGAPTLMVS